MANISLGFDLQALKKDATGATNIIKAAATGFADAANKANESIANSTKEAAKGFGSLQTQFRAAQKEALTLAAKYGSTSDAALQAAKNAGQLKDELNDQKAIINAFSADSKFTVVAGAMQQAAGAATIATGAMGLFGIKSGETAEMLLKVQSALALTQGLAQIKEMSASFTALGAVIKVDVIPSILAMDAAMAASVVGAIAVASIAIIGLTSDMNEAAESADRLAASNQRIEDSEKALQAAVQASRAANAKVRGLEIEGMEDGRAKEEAMSKDKILNLRMEAEAEFQASQQTIYDKQRLGRTLAAIETLQQKELKAIRDKYKPAPFEPVRNVSSFQTIAPDTTAMANEMVSTMDKLSAKVSQLVKPISLENLLPTVGKSTWAQTLDDYATEFQNFTSTIANLAVGAAGDLAFSFGEMLAGADFGKDMKQMLSQLMSQTANALMALGIALAPVSPTQAAWILGGAAALKIAAGALSASGGGGGSPSSPVGGRGISNPSMTPNFTGSGSGGYGRMEFRATGHDLVVVVDGQKRRNRR